MYMPTIQLASDIIQRGEMIDTVTFNQVEIPLPVFQFQRRIIKRLEDEVEMLRDEVEELRSIVSRNVIFVREVPYPKAKQMVLDFIRKHKEGIYTVDIAKELNLDISLVLKIAGELKEEDKIGESDYRY